MMLKGIREYLFKPRGKTGKIIEKQEEAAVQVDALEETISNVDLDKIRQNMKRYNNHESA